MCVPLIGIRFSFQMPASQPYWYNSPESSFLFTIDVTSTKLYDLNNFFFHISFSVLLLSSLRSVRNFMLWILLSFSYIQILFFNSSGPVSLSCHFGNCSLWLSSLMYEFWSFYDYIFIFWINFLTYFYFPQIFSVIFLFDLRHMFLNLPRIESKTLYLTSFSLLSRFLHFL